MAEAKQSAFEGWAIVEPMGHQREIGFVTTEAYGQAVLFRIDTPELPEREFVLTAPESAIVDGVSQWCPAGSKVKREAFPARSRLVAPGSLYAINPCSEAAARTAMERNVHRALIAIDVPKNSLALLNGGEFYPDEDEDDSEREFDQVEE